MAHDHYDVSVLHFDNGAAQISIAAGRKTQERIVPPVGERYAFVRDVWPHRITVAVSPTGRVRTFIDGKEIKP